MSAITERSRTADAFLEGSAVPVGHVRCCLPAMQSVLGTLLLVATVGCSMATQRPTLINPTFGIAARRPGDSPADGCHLFARQPKERLRTDAVVRVYSPRGECSGALVGPDLVL